MHEERRKQWTFVIGDAGLWSWRVLHPDCTATISEQAFPTLRACVEDAVTHGYVLPPADQDRRRERRSPPSVMISQEARCPHCAFSWDLARDEFVAVGERLVCRSCREEFRADAATIECCIETAEGLQQMPLPTH